MEWHCSLWNLFGYKHIAEFCWFCFPYVIPTDNKFINADVASYLLTLALSLQMWQHTMVAHWRHNNFLTFYIYIFYSHFFITLIFFKKNIHLSLVDFFLTRYDMIKATRKHTTSSSTCKKWQIKVPLHCGLWRRLATRDFQFSLVKVSQRKKVKQSHIERKKLNWCINENFFKTRLKWSKRNVRKLL